MKRQPKREPFRSLADSNETERPNSEVKPRAQNDARFSEVYGTWQPRVRRWVSSLGAPAGDIDDVTQEVFIIVGRKLSEFQGGDLRSWLFRITQLTVRDFRRKAWFRRTQHGTIEQVEKVLADTQPEGLYETRQSLNRVAEALARMTGIHREIFVLFALQGHSGEEIAAQYQIPIATVWSRIHRARKQLTRAMRRRRRRLRPGVAS